LGRADNLIRLGANLKAGATQAPRRSRDEARSKVRIHNSGLKAGAGDGLMAASTAAGWASISS
jgi:hypothetical protein